MIDYIKILKENPNGVLATQDGGKVKTCVFQYLFAKGDQVYFCTSKEKDVYKRLVKNPNLSFCTYTADYSPVLSINGKAVFVEDAALKARALDENPLIKDIYGSPENPAFKIFYVRVEEIETYSFKDGPQVFSFK